MNVASRGLAIILPTNMQVKQGDEHAAKQVLKEKASTKEAMERAGNKAELNYALAARLAIKIGEILESRGIAALNSSRCMMSYRSLQRSAFFP